MTLNTLMPKHWRRLENGNWELGPYLIEHHPSLCAELFKLNGQGEYDTVKVGYLHECVLAVPDWATVVEEQRILDRGLPT